jgi:ArsR family transcriptional regulator, arsenate/arsenite/antimonite-responsive transcriptional repressor
MGVNVSMPIQIDDCQWEAMVTGRSARAKKLADDLCCGSLFDTPLDEADAEELAGVLGALSDPVRLQLLSLVAAHGEVCSCDLEEPLDRTQPTISHHTRMLADAGIIAGEKRGKWTWWTIVPGRLEAVRRALGG